MKSLSANDIKVKISSQQLRHFKLDCEGVKARKWRIKMNMKTKRMWVNLKSVRTYSIPITYSQWDNDSQRPILVIAGKNKKQVKATINRNHDCRLHLSKLRYTYSINAKVARVGLLSGCCIDIKP